MSGEVETPEDLRALLRVSGPIKRYYIATLTGPAEGSPGCFTSRAAVCKTKPQTWPEQALIQTASMEIWPTQNEAHLQGFRRAKGLLDEIRA